MSAAEEIWRNSDAAARILDDPAKAEAQRQVLGIQTFIDTTPAKPATSDQSEHPGIPLWGPDRHAELAAMGEPLGLRGDQLPGYETVPPGCCPGCHYPVLPGTDRCWYCAKLAELRTAQQRTGPDGKPYCLTCGREGSHARNCRRACQVPPPRPVVRPLALIGVAIALLVVSVYLVPWLSLAAVFLLTAAFYRAMRSQP